MIMSLDASVSSASLEECSVDRSTPVPSSTSAAAAAATANTQPAMGGSEADNTQITKPKRPLSAYNMFFRDQRELLLESLPSRHGKKPKRSHGKINFNDLAKTIAAKWKEISPEEKAKYESVAAVGREKYVKLAKEWKKQQRKLAKQKKRAESSSSTTAKASAGPVALPIKSPITHRYPSNEAPAVMASTGDIMTGRVASSRLQSHSLDVGSRGYDMESSNHSAHPDYPAEISMSSAVYGNAAPSPSPYEPIPAFEDLEPHDPSTAAAAAYDNNRHVWNEMPPREAFMFDNNNNYNRQQQQESMMMMMMNMTNGSTLRAAHPRNTYAFDNQQQLAQQQRRDAPTLRPSTSLPHMTTFMDASSSSTWGHLNNMDPPRRLHSLPSGNLNATWEMQMAAESASRMMQPSLPFAPSNTVAYGSMMQGGNVALNPLFETSMSSSVDYYQSDAEPSQPQQASNPNQSFHDLQPEPLPFDYPNTNNTNTTQQQQQQPYPNMHPYGGMYGNNNNNLNNNSKNGP